jgi:hypothetical protein
MSGKTFKAVFVLMLTAIIVAPSAFAEIPKGLVGFADKSLGGTLYLEEKETVIWKGGVYEDGGGFFSKFGHLDPSSMFHGKDAGFWRGDRVIEGRKSWILDGLIREDLAISERKGHTEIKGFENTGILVGLSYSFSNFRLQDLRKSINAFLKNFDVTAPRSIKNVSVYIAFPEF